MSQWKYIEEFLALRCAADIIGVAHPVNQFAKEITEAMGIVKKFRGKMISSPMDYNLVDLCSGNALTPLISAHMLPSKWNYAIDIKPRFRPWQKVKRFTYLHLNIHEQEVEEFINHLEGPVIITASHACDSLSERAANLYNRTKATMLVLMPCCVGKFPYKLSEDLEKRIGRDNLWGLHLSNLVNGRISQDDKIISPKNRIIIAEKL